uniref:F-box only protein 31-like isoform X1 n=1 Tax=Crassostrea virginica TaxID=6565 RepID=A0A8B8EDE4_CRAVI|nr:F-box only protein 31-like isoform X1 [Crassostrea virginica]
MEFLSLPPELLSRILCYVPGRDLSNVCRSCKILRDAAYVDSVWQRKCEEEYSFKSNDGWNVSYRCLYNKVLCRYGDSIGLWRRDLEYYGGLLQVKYDKGCIKGTELIAPICSCVDGPLRKKAMFTISMTSEGKVEVVSVHDTSSGPRPCLLRVERDKAKERVLEYKVPDKDYIIKAKDARDHPLLQQWMQEELESEYMDIYFNCFFRRSVTLLSSRHHYQWSPLKLPCKSRVNAPIQPGLFKGTYSAHGIEVLSLDYDEELTEVTVTKITGDPNVPATKVSVKGDLTSSLVLTAEEQGSIRDLNAASQRSAAERDLPEKQPFVIPENCFDRDISDIPKSCSFRCKAKGQIASHGYKHSSFSEGHFVVFDESKFGMVWLELMSFSIYYRVDDKELND